MQKNMEKNEKAYIIIFWGIVVFLSVLLVFYPGTDALFGKDLALFKLRVLYFLFLITALKTYMIWQNRFPLEGYFYFYRVTEILLFLSLTIFFSQHPWVYFLLLFPIFMTGLQKGALKAFWIAFFAYLVHLSVILISSLYLKDPVDTEIRGVILQISGYYIFIMLLPFLIHLDWNPRETKTSAPNRGNVEKDLSRLKKTNEMLEDSYIMLQNSNAELFTMHYIVKEINAILDVGVLARTVNDMVLGVTGARYVSLFFLTKDRKNLKLAITNIEDSSALLALVENIECEFVSNFFKNFNSLYHNKIEREHQPFLKNRKVGSIMMLPIHRGALPNGLILIEHHFEDYFHDDMLRFMEFVAQQFSLAFEKVSLYSKMHDLAIKDGLTRVYNRVFFQNKLNEELQKAEKFLYDLVIVLFDIDHFKRFNDQHGHMVGDRVIQHVVVQVQNQLRKGDILARFGGEEFVILFPTITLRQAFLKRRPFEKNWKKRL
jgi:GGDEF domain-containing protein